MSNTNNVTAETITTAQIRALRSEASDAGDSNMVDLCDLALARHEDCNDDGTPLIDPGGWETTRTEARAACDALERTDAIPAPAASHTGPGAWLRGAGRGARGGGQGCVTPTPPPPSLVLSGHAASFSPH